MNSTFRSLALAALLLVFTSNLTQAAQIDTFGKLQIMSDDHTFGARLTGMIQMDGDFYNSGSDDRELPSGTFIRRARIGVQGNFHEYEYALESDFAGDKNELTDGFIRRLVGPGKITVGQFKVFEGLERLTSAADITFIERSYVSDIVPGRKIGVAYNGNTRLIGYSGTVYNMREASDDETRPTNEGLGVVGRAYIAPINQRDMAVHFGLSVAREHTDKNGALVRVTPAGRAETYRNEAEDDFRFILADREDERADVNRSVFEALMINGPLSLQGEYMMGSVDTKTRTEDDFSAWYAQIAYTLTGEYRRYRFLRGEINRLEPNREMGAFEIAARYQQAERDNVTGAELTLTEFGVSYYANSNIRFLLNYGIANNKLINDDPKLLSLRGQFDF